jgi:flagellar basal-body rod protein FlgB
MYLEEKSMSDFTYELIKKGLDVSSLRQKTISSNVANINTPNYKVNKVEFEEYLTKAKDEISLKATHNKHFGIKSLEDIEPKVEKRENTSLNDNGNNVDIDLEMTELAANEIYYSILIQQLNAKLSNLNYVINK